MANWCHWPLDFGMCRRTRRFKHLSKAIQWGGGPNGLHPLPTWALERYPDELAPLGGTATRRRLRSSGWPARRPPTTINNTSLSGSPRRQAREREPAIWHIAPDVCGQLLVACGLPFNGPPAHQRVVYRGSSTDLREDDHRFTGDLVLVAFPFLQAGSQSLSPPLRVSTLVTTGQKNAGTFFLFHLPVVGGFSGLI